MENFPSLQHKNIFVYFVMELLRGAAAKRRKSVRAPKRPRPEMDASGSCFPQTLWERRSPVCLKCLDRPGVFIRFARLQGGQVVLLGQVLNNILTGGKTEPGLQADEGRIRLGRVPDAQVAHLGNREPEAPGPRPSPEGDCAVEILEDDGVAVKEAVAQREVRAVFQRIRGLLDRKSVV